MPPRPSKLYHGTATVYLPSILKEGLRPGRDDVVYLTDTQAIGFAQMATHRANMDQDYRDVASIRPVVLEIDATQLDPSKLKAFQRPGRDTVGTLEYHGSNVPPSLIMRTALIDRQKAPELLRWAWDAQTTRGLMEKTGASNEAYDATCKELYNLIRWLFGEAPSEFDGPPERQRAGIKVIDLTKQRSRTAFREPHPLDRTAG